MQYDLLIIGGGVVGAGLAVALRNMPLRVALVDAKLPDNNDPRLFALNHSSCQFLKNIGIWQELKDYAASIKQVHVSRKGKFGAVRLQSSELGLPELGHVVPAKHIEFALNHAMTSIANLDVYRPASLVSIQQDHKVKITIKQDDKLVELETKILIGADGAHSTVRQLAGIEAEKTDYHQAAIVTRTQLQRAHHHIAYERFTNDGAIAMLPLGEHEYATIWTLEKKAAEKLMALSDQAFLEILQTQFGYRLGRLEAIAHRHTFPLHMVKAKQQSKGPIFLLGNAAHALHPIAAQGFNLALHEVACLVDCLSQTVNENTIIDVEKLISMKEKIYGQEKISVNVSHRLSVMFSNPSVWMSTALQIGMLGFDAAAPLKKKFIEAMMGKSSHLPRLFMEKAE